MMNRAKTVTQANAQTFTIPSSVDADWRRFAGLLDGYAIAEELGVNLMRWAGDTVGLAMQRGKFEDSISVLDLRLMLFAVFRSDYMSGYTYTEHDPEVDFILQALSQKTGQPYTPKNHKSID